jgi:hypothetical protein
VFKILQAAIFASMITFNLPTLACSSFEFGTSGQGGMAHNFDWFTGMGFTAAWFVNARNVTKAGLNLYNSNPVAHWTSKYGSITYSLVGREFPVGGQNEMGLVIHAQQIAKADYPTALPELDVLQWIQYVLDTSSTVSEAVQNAQLVSPNSGTLNLHFFLCDATGACAVVEFVNGQTIAYQGSQLPAAAMTNTDYPTSLSAWQACASNTSCTNADNSLERFVQAAGFNAGYSGQDPLSYALTGLNAVAQNTNPITRYHFFNPMRSTGAVYFMAGTQTQWQSFDMSKMDFSCASAGRWFEVDLTATGDQTSMFQPYSSAEQQKLTNQVPAQPAWVPLIVNYPATTSCKDIAKKTH